MSSLGSELVDVDDADRSLSVDMLVREEPSAEEEEDEDEEDEGEDDDDENDDEGNSDGYSE